MKLATCGAALGAVLLALPSPARACGGNEGSTTVTVLGWTDGGRLFSWKTETVPPSDEVGPSEPTRVDLETLDLRTSEHRIVASYEVVEEPDEEADAETKAAFQKQKQARAKADAWLAAHPATAAKSQRASPDGAAQLDAEVEFVNAEDKGTWTAKNWKGQATLLTKLLVVRGGKKAVSLVAPEAAATGYWAPDGKRVVWDLGGEKFRVGPAGSPRIQVLAPAKRYADLVPPALDALEAAGLPAVQTGPAKKPRPQSAVFFAKGFEQAAQAAAKATPGGATVEALSWQTDADLVVALGDSATKAGTP
ncbi:MAG TPA: hypothetical protein VGK67_41020 [Myxococcales bacterium]|jgi:hypothetical protein